MGPSRDRDQDLTVASVFEDSPGSRRQLEHLLSLSSNVVLLELIYSLILFTDKKIH